MTALTIRDTIARFEETGSPMITDGALRYARVPIIDLNNLALARLSAEARACTC
jgi:hypothetical protein